MTWLENKLYVLCDNANPDNVRRLRVFADHAPYEELPEGIVLEGIKEACGMAASVSTRAIFFCEPFKQCIWKLQIPNNEMKRFPVRFMPFRLSVGQDDELFVIRDNISWRYSIDAGLRSCSIDIFRLADVSFVKSIRLTKDIYRVCCVAQSPNRDIVITHYTLSLDSVISILSTNGEIIRTFNPESLQQWWNPRSFVIADTGDIFVVDHRRGMIYMLNSQFTDIQNISYSNVSQWSSTIVYSKENQQLLISELLPSVPVGMDTEGEITIHVFHLSPCNLETRKTDEEFVIKGT